MLGGHLEHNVPLEDVSVIEMFGKDGNLHLAQKHQYFLKQYTSQLQIVKAKLS